MPPGRGEGIRVVVDSGRNTLRLLIPQELTLGLRNGDDAPTVQSHQAILDVGEAGRLLGLELAHGSNPADPWYLDLEDAPGDQLRSVTVTVAVARDLDGQPVWVDLPRRGEGYELTFPIGNQCWVRPRRRTI